VSPLKYKDYQGSVSFEDGKLLVQILHIDDFITTECDSAAGAQLVRPPSFSKQLTEQRSHEA